MMEATHTTTIMDIATVNNSSDRSSCTDKSPERERMSLISCRIAMSEKARAMSIQAIRFRVIRISLNTHTAAVNWRKIEMLNTRGKLISYCSYEWIISPFKNRFNSD